MEWPCKMKIENLPFMTFDWARIAAEEAPGEAGTSFIKSFDAGDFRCRLVTYEAGYVADHWCSKGHVFLILKGEAALEFESGHAVSLTHNQGFCVDDVSEPHRIRTRGGATAFILD